ncbi:MAG: hypothetical protein ACKV2V_00035 [Blastocatellia bacterium]
MRTLFEDTDEKADQQDAGPPSVVPRLLWLLALVLVTGMVATYFIVQKIRDQRVADESKPPPVSLNDPYQVNKTISAFNQFITAQNWTEAEKMLSADGRTRLETEKKTLSESMFVDRIKAKKDPKPMLADLTPSTDRTENSFRVDCVYTFEDKTNKILSVTVVKEGERLAINSW